MVVDIVQVIWLEDYVLLQYLIEIVDLDFVFDLFVIMVIFCFKIMCNDNMFVGYLLFLDGDGFMFLDVCINDQLLVDIGFSIGMNMLEIYVFLGELFLLEIMIEIDLDVNI